MTPVFVLTLSDLIGLIVIGLWVMLFGGLLLWSKLDRWVRYRADKNTTHKPWSVDRDGRVRTDKDRPVELRAREPQR